MTNESDMDSSAVVYLREMEETREQRHKENIQILAAIGILGAYVTIISTNMDFSWALNAVVQFIGWSSFVFLMYKLLVNSSIPLLERDSIPKLDAAISGLYVISITLFAGVFITIIAARELDIAVEDIGSAVMILMIVFVFLYLIGMMYLIGTRKAQLAVDQADALWERMPAVLAEAEKVGELDTSRKEALVDRTQAILERDGSPHWINMHGMLTDRGEPLQLATRDREQLLNILDRIERKANYNEYDEEDIELVDAIISRAEEKTQLNSKAQETEIGTISE